MTDLDAARKCLALAIQTVDNFRVEIKRLQAEVGAAVAAEEGWKVGDRILYHDGVPYELTNFWGAANGSFTSVMGVKLKKNGQKYAGKEQWLAYDFDKLERLT